MDTNDFIGSFAQENVSFATQVIKTAVVGDNFWKVMVFVENSRFVDSSAWPLVPGSTSIKAKAITADDYATETTGLLQSWLYDLFCSGFTGDCILVACGENVPVNYTYTEVTPAGTENPQEQGWYVLNGSDYELTTDTSVQAGTTYYTRSGTADPSTFISNMDTAYALMKAYAYHKTVCAGSDDALLPEIAVELASLCSGDKQLLSGCPLLPYTTSVPDTPATDPLYNAVKTSGKDAFFSAHQDSTRNGALLSLGIALATYNGSGTPVGSGMDMRATGYITPSGPNGTNLPKVVRDTLYGLHIQTWKPVGDNTGNVAAMNDRTILDDVYSANWIIAYIGYMTKVSVAQMMTQPEFLKNADNYSRILGVLNSYLSKFDGGRLTDIKVTAPGYGGLPEAAGDEIVIPNAWSAQYVDHVRKVTITGTLYIGV